MNDIEIINFTEDKVSMKIIDDIMSNRHNHNNNNNDYKYCYICSRSPTKKMTCCGRYMCNIHNWILSTCDLKTCKKKRYPSRTSSCIICIERTSSLCGECDCWICKECDRDRIHTCTKITL